MCICAHVCVAVRVAVATRARRYECVFRLLEFVFVFRCLSVSMVDTYTEHTCASRVHTYVFTTNRRWSCAPVSTHTIVQIMPHSTGRLSGRLRECILLQRIIFIRSVHGKPLGHLMIEKGWGYFPKIHGNNIFYIHSYWD